MLQSMGLQRVGHDLASEQKQQCLRLYLEFRALKTQASNCSWMASDKVAPVFSGCVSISL